MNDDEEEEMKGKRREEEDSLVVEKGMIVKFPFGPFATFLLPLQLLLQGSFHQEKVKQPHCRETQRLNIRIMWCLLRHQITYHTPPCPVRQSSVTTVARISLKKSSLSKHMSVVHGASRP